MAVQGARDTILAPILSSILCFSLTEFNIGAELLCFITDVNGDIGNTRLSAIKLDNLFCSPQSDASDHCSTTSFYKLLSIITNYFLGTGADGHTVSRIF